MQFRVGHKAQPIVSKNGKLPHSGNAAWSPNCSRIRSTYKHPSCPRIFPWQEEVACQRVLQKASAIAKDRRNESPNVAGASAFSYRAASTIPPKDRLSSHCHSRQQRGDGSHIRYRTTAKLYSFKLLPSKYPGSSPRPHKLRPHLLLRRRYWRRNSHCFHARSDGAQQRILDRCLIFPYRRSIHLVFWTTRRHLRPQTYLGAWCDMVDSLVVEYRFLQDLSDVQYHERLEWHWQRTYRA